MGRALTGPDDPRWVLALRTSEQLEGTVLPTEKRARLIQLGERLGLSAFDANLVIAIVQDQARRGFAPQWCPAAGEQQLTLVPLHPPGNGAWDQWLSAAIRGRGRIRGRALYIAWAIAGIIAVELLVLWAVVG